MTKPWVNKAFALLDGSLQSPQHEVNELDWKLLLSSDRGRLTEHLSAFGNLPGGGFLVFGVRNDGDLIGIQQLEIDETVNKLVNLGRDAVEPPLILDHSAENFRGVHLLFVRVRESDVKPVHIRGKP